MSVGYMRVLADGDDRLRECNATQFSSGAEQDATKSRTVEPSGLVI